MALIVYKNGKIMGHWSAVAGSTAYNEKNERRKDPSLYNINQEKRGLSNE